MSAWIGTEQVIQFPRLRLDALSRDAVKLTCLFRLVFGIFRLS